MRYIFPRVQFTGGLVRQIFRHCRPGMTWSAMLGVLIDRLKHGRYTQKHFASLLQAAGSHHSLVFEIAQITGSIPLLLEVACSTGMRPCVEEILRRHPITLQEAQAIRARFKIEFEEYEPMKDLLKAQPAEVVPMFLAWPYSHRCRQHIQNLPCPITLSTRLGLEALNG